jgi:hypothetical protein
MDPEEARQSLELVRQAAAQTRQAVSRSGTGQLFIIWGTVWLLGFLGTELLGNASGYLWLVLDILAGAATVIVAVRSARRFRSSFGWRVGMWWVLLMAYGGIMLWTAWPVTGSRYLVFVTLLVSFGYVTLGLWFSPPLLYAGLGITALALLGWLLVPAYLSYLISLLGGGGMIALGVYLRRGGN